MIKEAIKLLEKEIHSLNFNLINAKKKTKVTPDEIANIEKKIKLKTKILNIVKEVAE